MNNVMRLLVLVLLRTVGCSGFTLLTSNSILNAQYNSASSFSTCKELPRASTSCSAVSTMLSTTDKKIYGVPNSGWKSPHWNWGSASGTGHDCAAICRRTYGTPEARQELVSSLLSGDTTVDFEEVKLAMALAWQNGRWDGSDGGPGGYGDVLRTMAQAKRYEDGSEEECAQNLTQDMQSRFHLLKPTEEQKIAMDRLSADCQDALLARNRCSGLVLKAMGFVENG